MRRHLIGARRWGGEVPCEAPEMLIESDPGRIGVFGDDYESSFVIDVTT